MENNYQLSRIYNYLHGLMSKEEMHALEREALDDPLLQEALEGYALKENVDMQALSLLQKRLQDRVAHAKDRKHRQFFAWQRLAIASSAAVLFVVACVFILMRTINHTKQEQITEVNLGLVEKGVEVDPMFSERHSDGFPVEGWEHFSHYLSQRIGALDLQEPVVIIFQIQESGEPSRLEFRPEVPQEIKQSITSILQKGPRWKGTEGQFRVIIYD